MACVTYSFPAMDAIVRPNKHVALRLPSGTHKIISITPDTIISLGKFGSFSSNLILGRPYYLTFEVVEHGSNGEHSELRLVPASESHAETLADELSAAESRDDASAELEEAEADQKAEEILQNNRLTVDDASRQALAFEDIEELKKHAKGSGKDIVAKILESHSAIGEKTAFSLAKYLVRKNRKYMKRFTVLPLDVSMLAWWVLHEREAAKIMEIREETLGLMASWSNVHYTPNEVVESLLSDDLKIGSGRWLVVDDTAGLLVASMAERMGILHADIELDDGDDIFDQESSGNAAVGPSELPAARQPPMNDYAQSNNAISRPPKPKPHDPSHLAHSNTITLVHAAAQPNLSLLSYFDFDPNDTPSTSSHSNQAPPHPLHTHLHTLTWLELLNPESSSSYTEPTPISPTTLSTLKSNKRGQYHRKRRRWERTRTTVDSTRAGGFDGLVVASHMEPCEILHHLVPLLRGGAPIVVYSPTRESLVNVMDAYSSTRRTAFINALQLQQSQNGVDVGGSELKGLDVPSDEFPVDPRLVLAPSLQTVRAREWQVLPGRTHPKMTERGGPEGYIFTGTRVLPTEGKVEARGRFAKKRKAEDEKAIAAATSGVKEGAAPKQAPVEVEESSPGTMEATATKEAPMKVEQPRPVSTYTDHKLLLETIDD